MCRRWPPAGVSSGPVIRLPFLGAWPLWQQALRQEVCALVAASEPIRWRRRPLLPLLLHHPLRSSLAGRYLAHLGPFCGATCLPTPYSRAGFRCRALAA